MTLPLSDEDLEVLEAAINGYLLAVADLVMRDGVPLASRGMCVFTGENEVSEGEGRLRFPPDFPERIVGRTATEFNVIWDSRSGWAVTAEYYEPESDGYSYTYRWMGAGLVPEPAQVAGFLSRALIDFFGAGTEERPYYRDLGEDFSSLADRLAAYSPGREHHVAANFEPWFARKRREACHRLTLGDIAAAEPARPVPLRQGEMQALCRLLDWVDADGHEQLRDLSNALASDLRARFTASGSTSLEDLPSLTTRFQQAWTTAQDSRPAGEQSNAAASPALPPTGPRPCWTATAEGCRPDHREDPVPGCVAFTTRDALLAELAQRSALDGCAEVALDDDLIDQLRGDDDRLPVPHTELRFTLAASTPRDLETGTFTLTVVSGSRHAGARAAGAVLPSGSMWGPSYWCSVVVHSAASSAWRRESMVSASRSWFMQ